MLVLLRGVLVGRGRGVVAAAVALTAEEVRGVRGAQVGGGIILGQATVSGLGALETELRFFVTICRRRQLLCIKTCVQKFKLKRRCKYYIVMLSTGFKVTA